MNKTIKTIITPSTVEECPQLKFALMFLKTEVNSGYLITNPRVATTLNTISWYIPNLPKTRKSAYKKLVELGFYKD